MAKKLRNHFVCSQCGASYAKWVGKCSECEAWDSIIEEVRINTKSLRGLSSGAGVLNGDSSPVRLKDIKLDSNTRHKTGISELDIVLGGGLVKGSLLLVGGDPGIGKSTLLLQAAENIAGTGLRVLYVSGEESLTQIKMRAERIKASAEELYIVSESNIEAIISMVENLQPDVLIVDSIQTISSYEIASAPGSVTQVREATNKFMVLAKTKGITTFLVGHVTKSGSIAGPKILEHMVDTVLYFEGDCQKIYRILRAVKNRFGSTNEIGVFEMRLEGLMSVDNPSELFIRNKDQGEPGTVIIPAIEGSRTVLIELQCLVSDSNFNNPRRMTAGIDYNRLVLLTAVLEKRAGMKLYQSDVYINVAGGVEIDEPSVDLAITMAIASSHKNFIVPNDLVVIGEVGLTGEIRQISHAQQRINEAARMGFTKAIIPHENLRGLKKPKDFTVIGLKHISEMIKYLS